MTKKEVNEILIAATKVVNNIKSIDKIDEMIGTFENYELKEGASFTTELYAWQAGSRTAKYKLDLNLFLSSDDQAPLRKIIIDALKEKREEYISDFQKAAGSLEKLAKEVLNE